LEFSFSSLDKITQGNPSAKKELVSLFISEITKSELPELENAILKKDFKLINRKAHGIKSNLRLFGMYGLKDRFQELENQTKEGFTSNFNLVQATELISDLKLSCEDLENAIKSSNLNS